MGTLFLWLKKHIKEIISVILLVSLITIISMLVFRSHQQEEKENYRLNIAIVNEDQGQVFNDQGYNFGNDFINLLTKDKKSDWYTVSRGVAENGIRHKRYDLVIIIPNQFSKKVLKFQSTNFKRAKIIYKVRENDNTNLRLSIEQQTNQILNKLNAKVSNMYYASILYNLHQAQKHMGDISDSETNLESNLGSDVNSPLKNFLKNYDQNNKDMENAKDLFNGDYFNQLEGGIQDSSNDLDTVIQSINDKQSKAKASMQSLADNGNQVLEENNLQSLNFFNQQYNSFTKVISEDGDYVSTLQGETIQSLISDLLNEKDLSNLPDDGEYTVVNDLQNQQDEVDTQSKMLKRKLLEDLPELAKNPYGKTASGLIKDKLESSLQQVPSNAQEILNNIQSKNYLTPTKYASLQNEVSQIAYYQSLYNISTSDVDNNFTNNLNNSAKSITGTTFRIKVPKDDEGQVLSFSTPSFLTIDMDDLISQLDNQKIDTDDISSTSSSVTLPKLDKDTYLSITPKFKVNTNNWSLYSSDSWSYLLTSGSDSDQKIGKSYTISSQSSDTSKETELKQLINFVGNIDKTGSIISFLYDSDSSNNNLMSQILELESNDTDTTDSNAIAAYNTKIQPTINLLDSQSDNIDSALEEISQDKYDAIQDRKLTNIRIQKLAVELQKSYQSGIDLVQSHSSALSNTIDLNTTKLTPDLSALDFSENTSQIQGNQEKLKNLLEQSKQIADDEQQKAEYIVAVNNNSKEIINNGKKIVNQSNILLNNWKKVVSQNNIYNDNFGNTMGNTKNDDNSSRDIYDKLSRPLSLKNEGTIRNNRSIMPYFLTIINVIIALFTAFLISEVEKYKYVTNLLSGENGKSIFIQLSTLVSIVIGLAIAYISFHPFSNSYNIYQWLFFETIIQSMLIVISTLLLRALKLTGAFIFSLFFIQYIFFTPAMGVYLTNQTWVGKFIDKFAPFQIIENNYTNAIDGKSLPITFILICLLILVVSIILNLRIGQKKAAVEDDDE